MAFEFTVDKNQFKESSCCSHRRVKQRPVTLDSIRTSLHSFNHHFELRITFWDCFNKTAGCHEKVFFFTKSRKFTWLAAKTQQKTDRSDRRDQLESFLHSSHFSFFILDVNWWLQFFGSFQLNKITAFFFLQCEQHDWQGTWTFIHFLQS